MLTSEKPSGSTGWKTPSRTWTEVLVILLAAAFVTLFLWLLFGRSFDFVQGWASRVAFLVLGVGAIYLLFRRKSEDKFLADKQEELRRALDNSPYHPDEIDRKRYAGKEGESPSDNGLS